METWFKFLQSLDVEKDYYTLEYEFSFLGRRGSVEVKMKVFKEEAQEEPSLEPYYTIADENGETLCSGSSLENAVAEAERHGYKDKSEQESIESLLSEITFSVADQWRSYTD